MSHAPPETHLFVVWEHGRHVADRIVADIERHFTVLAGFEVTWSQGAEPRHFSRLYGQSLPADSDKVRRCGLGPFLLLVVRDRTPRYAARRKWGKRVVVNTRLFDAKERYRGWTGGHQVHNSTDQAEADRDLLVLLGRRRQEFEELSAPWDGRFLPVVRDPAGSDGWDDLDQLLTAVDLTLPSLVLPEREPGEDRLRLLVEVAFDHWGVEWLVAAPNDVPLAQRGAEFPILVAGRPTLLELHRIGDGHMPTGWQRALLDHRVRDADGRWVPHPDHAYGVLLHTVAGDGGTPTVDQQARLLDVASRTGAEPVDATDPAVVRAALSEHARRCEALPPVQLPVQPSAQRHGLAQLLGRRRQS